MYTTPTFITEVLRSSTAAFNDCYSELMPYTALAYCTYRVSYHDADNAKAIPINDTQYSYYITAVHIMPHHATSY